MWVTLIWISLTVYYHEIHVELASKLKSIPRRVAVATRLFKLEMKKCRRNQFVGTEKLQKAPKDLVIKRKEAQLLVFCFRASRFCADSF